MGKSSEQAGNLVDENTDPVLSETYEKYNRPSVGMLLISDVKDVDPMNPRKQTGKLETGGRERECVVTPRRGCIGSDDCTAVFVYRKELQWITAG